jgi:Leucine-rich repeat (LRR) protein
MLPIPDDVWREIGQLAVSSLAALFELWTVCKQFRRAFSHPLMLSRFPVRLDEPAQLARLGSLGARLKSVQFNHASNASLESILLPTTLTSLNLKHCRVSARGLTSALRGLSQLTELNVDGCLGLENLKALMHLPLVSLVIGCGHRHHFWDADEVLPALPALRSLDLNSMGLCANTFDREGSESPCVAAMSRLRNLHTLILEGADLHDREFAKLAPLSTTVRTLCVAHTKITDHSAGVLSEFVWLENLTVDNCQLSTLSFRAICTLVNLRGLFASNCPEMVCDASLPAIGALIQLETLDISFNPVKRFEPLYALQELCVLDATQCRMAKMDGWVTEDQWDMEAEARRGLCAHVPGLLIRCVDSRRDMPTVRNFG